MKAKPVYLLVVVSIYLVVATGSLWWNDGHAADRSELLTRSSDQDPATTSKENKTVTPEVLDKEKTALLNWAAYLSGYKTIGQDPQLQLKSNEFFIKHACEGRDQCRVLGWYDDNEIVYIDERLSNIDSMFVRSLIVHEFVHYLQHISGKFAVNTCAEFVQREREAYAAQQQYFVAHGSMPQIQTHYYSCEELEDNGTALAHGY
ncbi:MAG: hypothetical protein OER96_05595 [Gammaproteobacteria bacterium]|nr:hypothetical protein [Gammaproteobacteria bacterium]